MYILILEHQILINQKHQQRQLFSKLSKLYMFEDHHIMTAMQNLSLGKTLIIINFPENFENYLPENVDCHC